MNYEYPFANYCLLLHCLACRRNTFQLHIATSFTSIDPNPKTIENIEQYCTFKTCPLRYQCFCFKLRNTPWSLGCSLLEAWGLNPRERRKYLEEMASMP